MTGGHNENAIKNLKRIINDYYPNDKKIYIISILKSKDYRTLIKLITKKEGIFIFTSGNDEKRYVSKETLYSEAEKYLSDKIYCVELKDAINYTLKNCKDEIVMVIRKLLCLRRCS